MATIHVLRTGTFTDHHGREVTLTPADLQELAASYAPAHYRAPVVVGHPRTNAPAFGWLTSVTAKPGRDCPAGDCWDLEAEADDLDPDFLAAVRAGRYRQVSLSYWPADHPGNPTPGSKSIAHLGFLGAAAPAVKGLRGVDLAANGGELPGIVCPLAFADEAPTESADPQTDQAGESAPAGAAAGPEPDPDPDPAPDPDLADVFPRLHQQVAAARAAPPPTPAPEPLMTQLTPEEQARISAELAADRAKLDAERAALDAEREALHQRAAAARAAENVAFADGLVKQFGLIPALQARIEAALGAVPADAAPISFADPDGQTVTAEPMRLLRDLLRAVADPANRVDFSERAPAPVAGDPAAPPVSFAAPADYQMDPANKALFERAAVYARAHNTDIISAAKAVGAH